MGFKHVLGKVLITDNGSLIKPHKHLYILVIIQDAEFFLLIFNFISSPQPSPTGEGALAPSPLKGEGWDEGDTLKSKLICTKLKQLGYKPHLSHEA
ncbi:MAG: hypothetical protein PSN44_08275 [Gammaproteobacteria bacterium]|nr:hypothetical protein [Gammaproteobacteria bacterium]